MTTYQKFKKLNIRHSAIGLEQSDTDVTYYCTPRDAAIIGWAGVDGIHYCTIPEFGEMIFAVSPMNFGDCVHPIAHSFEDLLRLLLSCGSMDALEQCYAWDEEQFKAFLIDCPATEEQQSVLDVLRTEFRLVPLEDAFAYHRRYAFGLWRGRYQGAYPQSGKLAQACVLGCDGSNGCVLCYGNLPHDEPQGHLNL